ncbi:hypothetical protein DPMN_187592, partial [Dreissena polymorpha]
MVVNTERCNIHDLLLLLLLVVVVLVVVVVAIILAQTDRQTNRQTNRQGKNNMSPTTIVGDISRKLNTSRDN